MSNMKIEELHNEEMYALCAPDGSVQLGTLAPEFTLCMAIMSLMEAAGLAEPVGKLFEQGYHIMPVKVSIIQNGDEHDAFARGKMETKE
jgi:hypothetical protein